MTGSLKKYDIMSLTIDVPIAVDQSYTVTVGRDIWESFKSFCSETYSPHKLVVVIDEQVQELHGSIISEQCSAYFEELQFCPVPQGEKSKSVGMWNKMLDSVLAEGVERSTPLLAIGGGVTGDLAGFVAATALRGIPLIHMPTSLLAMVDSSIGGKTGVNHPTGKNLVGSFYQPAAVFTDPDFLQTLPQKEWINGLSEILKYAAISEPSLVDSIARNVSAGFEPSENWTRLIAKSASIKCTIVSKDSLESGIRGFLNFGHTFGHALEKNAGYGTISHGEAVFIGMLAAQKASTMLGSPLDMEFFDPFIDLYNISPDITSLDVDELIDTMGRDKKVENGNIRLILLKEWGTPYIEICKEPKILKEAWQFAFERCNNATDSTR